MTDSRSLAEGRWFTLTLAEQLGNAGGEFERALRARRNGQAERFEKAFERLLELLDLTLADPRWRGGRLREIARLRDQVCEALGFGDAPPTGVEGLQRYFLAFAVAARSGSDR